MPPNCADSFASLYTSVVLLAAPATQDAQSLVSTVLSELQRGHHPSKVLRNRAKAAAIWEVWQLREYWFQSYQQADDKVALIQGLPWIGGKTASMLASLCDLSVQDPVTAPSFRRLPGRANPPAAAAPI